MKVLVACECSGTVRDAFINRGHNAISCDLQPTDVEGPHYQGSIFDIIDDGFDMLIAHPPCTYLTGTANRWLKNQPLRKSGALVGQARRDAQQTAILFFMRLVNANIAKICIENPVGVISSYWRKPDLIIQPYNFGHPEPKKTCLWLKGLNPLIPTKTVTPEYTLTKSGKRMATWYYYANCKGENRSKLRSKTFQGIADAMAKQWGRL